MAFPTGSGPDAVITNALDALQAGILRKRVNWVLDADVQGFFSAMSHDWTLRFLEHRIADKRILRLIAKWLRAKRSTRGAPQGAVNLLTSAAVAGCFIVVDSAFFIANAAKIAEGGYVPLALAACVYGIMWVWHSGREAVMQAIAAKQIPIDQFMADIAAKGVPRLPGTAVFLTRAERGVPPVMAWHVKHSRALHERIMVINVSIEPVPWVRKEDRLLVVQEAPDFWRATANFGFMERPDIPAVLSEAKEKGCNILLDDVTYYVGRETVVSRVNGQALPKWQESLFAAMERNANQVTDFFRLPVDQVVEIGRQVAI